jgi:hypothetical protein
MVKRWKIIVATTALAVGASGGMAFAAVANLPSPPPTDPGTGSQGPYFTGQVGICVDKSDEARAYVELNNESLGNCAPGYVQLNVEAIPYATPSSGS